MIFLNIKDLIQIHDNILNNFGGLGGIKDKQQLESILTHIKNDKYYSDFIKKITHLFFGIIKFHCFNDGNKRTAIGAVTIFLELNNIEIPDIFVKLEDIAIGVAKGEIEKETLEKIFKTLFISFNINSKNLKINN